jgi:hypothetical protein
VPGFVEAQHPRGPGGRYRIVNGGKKFALSGEPARRKAAADVPAAKERTGYLFDMKRGDKRGQTTIMEEHGTFQVGHKRADGRGTPERLAKAKQLAAELRAKRSGFARKPASQIDAEGRQYAEHAQARGAELLQKMRQARHMATIESGRGRGTIDREGLQAERKRLGVTPEAVRAARGRQASLSSEAEQMGYRGGEVAALGRREAMARVREQHSGAIPMLSRGGGYYPSPAERIRARPAKRKAKP